MFNHHLRWKRTAKPQQRSAAQLEEEDVTRRVARLPDDVLAERAREGDVIALLAWRRTVESVPYEELGGGD